jgi:hypothetical protein
MIIYPTYSPEEIAKENAGIEAAGQRMLSSPENTEAFLRSLGFGALLDERDLKKLKHTSTQQAAGQPQKVS